MDPCRLAALILAAEDTAESLANNIWFRTAVHLNDYLPMSRCDILGFEGPTLVFSRAFKHAEVPIGDLDFAKVHDCSQLQS